MGLVEQSIAEVNSFYTRPHCVKENKCKHQFFRFNSMLGLGRYCCALKTDNMQNCDGQCDDMEE